MKLINTVLASAALALALGAGAAQAATYANANDDGAIFEFGYPDTTSYGQVFTAPGGALQSWTFYDQDASSNGAALVVASWNGSAPVGPALYEGLSQTVGSASGAFSHTYSGINLNLTAGDYIAYLTVAGVANPTGQVSVNGASSSPLGGGFFYYNSNGADPLQAPYAGQSWDAYEVPDMQYSATFGNAVPEPASWAMMLVGIGGLGVALRSNRRRVVATA